MGTEDRLKYDGTPRLKLPDDIGDYPILTQGASLIDRLIPSPTPPISPSERNELGNMPTEESFFRPQNQTIGYITVSDIIPPNRYRRVFQSISVPRSDLYGYPIKIGFFTSRGAIIQEELDALSPGPKAMRSPARSQKVTTHSGGHQSSYSSSQRPPRSAREKIPSEDLPFDTRKSEQLEAWETLGSEIGSSLDIESVEDALNGSETDDALETLGEIVRPTSWARHTILQIRYRYPKMEAFERILNQDLMPHGATFEDMDANTQLENSIKEFTMMPGSEYFIDVPYGVGFSLPLTFDVINRNPLYSASLNLTVTAYLSRKEG